MNRKPAMLRILPALLLLAGLTTRCGIGGPAPTPTPTLEIIPQLLPTEGGLPVDSGTPTSEEFPSALPANAISLSLDAPESVMMGEQFAVDVLLFATSPVAEAMLEISVPPLVFQIMDGVDAPGTQATPGVLPEGAAILTNEISPEGVVRYRVTGLGTSTEPQILLLTLNLMAIQPEIADITIQPTSAILGADGLPLPVQLPQTIFIDVLDTGSTGGTPPPTDGELTPLPTLLPSEGQPTAPPAGPSVGTIQPGIYAKLQAGQTVYSLAETFGTTAEQVAAANSLGDPNLVPVGTLLYLPVRSPAGQAAYLIAPHDTLYSIARTFNLTVETLAAQNGIPLPYNSIQAGRWLILIP